LKYETARDMLPRSALPKHFYLLGRTPGPRGDRKNQQ